jgi:DNA helicase-2/ATP-dependent DNA helicase PcrA
VDELLRELVSAIAYDEHLRAEGPGSAERFDNVRELITSAAETVQEEGGEIGLTPLDHFLQRATLITSVDQLDPGADAVTLMTLHNAKGLEYPVVYITGLEEGLFPLSRAREQPETLEEERRLFYVGITRARKRLVLAHADTRALYGGRDYRMPSRFLAEIPADTLEQTPRARRGSSFGASPAPAGPPLSMGDAVVHATFGEGVITGVEQGGELVLVHFSADGTDRRLMAGYAPMRKVTP